MLLIIVAMNLCSFLKTSNVLGFTDICECEGQALFKGKEECLSN